MFRRSRDSSPPRLLVSDDASVVREDLRSMGGWGGTMEGWAVSQPA